MLHLNAMMGKLAKAKAQAAPFEKATVAKKVLGLMTSAMVVVSGEIWMESSAQDKYVSAISLRSLCTMSVRYTRYHILHQVYVMTIHQSGQSYRMDN